MRKFNDQEMSDIIFYYSNGQRISDLSRKYHCRMATISNVLKEHNITPVRSRNPQKGWSMNHHYFDEIDTKEKAYFLGLLFTDGSVSPDRDGRSPAIRLELCETDYSIIDMFEEEIKYYGVPSYNKRKNRKNGTFAVSIRSKQLADSLAKYGVVQNKTYVTEHLPEIPNEYIRSFIHGLIDGDGSVYYSQKSWHINFCSHHKSICEDFERICSGLIGRDGHLAIQESNGVYRVTYNGKWAKALASECMNDGYGIARKRLKVEAMLNEDKVAEDIVCPPVKADG